MKQTSDKLDSFLHRKLADLQLGEEGDAGWDQVYSGLKEAGAYKSKKKWWIWTASSAVVALITALWLILPLSEMQEPKLASQTNSTVEMDQQMQHEQLGSVKHQSTTPLAEQAVNGPQASANDRQVNNQVTAQRPGQVFNSTESGSILGLRSRNAQPNRLKLLQKREGDLSQSAQHPISLILQPEMPGTTVPTDPGISTENKSTDQPPLQQALEDTLQAKSDDITDSLLNASEIRPDDKEKAKKSVRNQWHLFAGVQYEAAMFLNRSAMGTLPNGTFHEDFGAILQGSEKHKMAGAYGLNFTLQHSSGLRIISGIGVTRKLQVFEFDFVNAKAPIQNAEGSIIAYYQNPVQPDPVRFNSRLVFDYWNIPLGLGYTFQLKNNMFIGAEMGADLMFLRSAGGTELDWVHLQSRELNPAYVNKFHSAAWLGLQWATPVANKMIFTVQPRYTLGLNSVLNKQSAYQLKPSSLGIQLGLKYQLF